MTKYKIMKGTKDMKMTNIYDSLFQTVTEYHSIIKIYATVRQSMH